MTPPRDSRRRRSLVITLMVVLPLSCSRMEEEGEVSDSQGCRTIILPEPVAGEDSSTTDSGSTTDPAPFCGDGRPDPGEICDDGNLDDTDDCTSECKAARCSDGKVWAEMEECDDGNLDDSDDCTSGCRDARCGDGLVHLGIEECDNGSDNNGGNAACLGTCVAARCGDGYVQDGVEECDDTNAAEGDGCTPACYLERVVFVSSQVYTGDAGVKGLNGLVGADAICQKLAEDAGLGGSFKAWLSTEREGPVSRFAINAESMGPYMLVDGTVVAMGWDDLTDGLLEQSVGLDEAGNASAITSVWTNTGVDGEPIGGDDCGGWMMPGNGGVAPVGSSNYADGYWTDAGVTAACINQRHVYCFQVI